MNEWQAQLARKARQRLAVEQTRLPVRLRTAGWAAAVAAIPAYVAADTLTGPAFGDLVPIPLLDLVLMTLVSAALSGFLFGWRLLDPQRPHEGFKAIGLGIVTALLAYLLLADVSIFAGILLPSRYGGGDEYTFGGLLIALLAGPFFVLYWGILLTGWYTLLVAGLAGFALSATNHR